MPSVAVAVLSKDPKSIADDIMAMTANSGGNSSLDEADQKLQINVRDDLMANLGGDFLLSLDGPVLPTPSWKAVIEVNNASQLENTLERLVQTVNNQPQGTKVAPGRHRAQRRRIGSASTPSAMSPSGTVVANYTFSDGFMIVAPTRALLMEALQIHASGNSLGRSACVPGPASPG